MNHRTITLAAALVATATTPPSAAASTSAIAGPSLSAALTAAVQDGTYFRTRTATAVRNFPDENGSIFTQLPAGTLVRAYATSQGKPPYREVEIAGGFPVWVFGEFLQPTDVDGVLLVTGSRVNMRPSPELAPTSMPLRSKLDAGQRVRLVERANAASSFAQDWIRVQAPATTRAWIVADSIAPTASAGAEAAWAAANPPLPTRPTVKAPAAPREAASNAATAVVAPIVTADVLRALTDADEMFASASALRSPTSEDWRDVVLAYEGVVEAAPAGTITQQNAASRLERARVQMELAGVREELDVKAREHEEEVSRINKYIDQREKRETAHWGRFQERGWVDARPARGEQRWFLVFGGRTVAEIECTSARYDLSVFNGFEVGVLGTEIQPAIRATDVAV
ncbi:MAG: SH3 domain-containing protein, partial [Planctomycetota bacterium]